jgi:dihydrofolate reductase
MGRIIVSENITLDGVVQDPTGEEGARHGGWFLQVGSNDTQGFHQAALEEAARAEALLMGRRSYEYLAARWPSRTGELADRLRSIPKYVVSSTLKDPAWANTLVLAGDAASQVSDLKLRLTGEIVVPASRTLVRALIAADLVDELRLLVYPFVLGAGERLFGETGEKISLSLVASRTVGDHLPYLTYHVVRGG